MVPATVGDSGPDDGVGCPWPRPWRVIVRAPKPPARVASRATDGPKAKVATGDPTRPTAPNGRLKAPRRDPGSCEPNCDLPDRTSTPIAQARKSRSADCKAKYADRSRIILAPSSSASGSMASSTPCTSWTMKARTKPASLYFKFIPAQQPVGRRSTSKGENSDKIVAHDVGLGRMVAGTMHLDPKGGHGDGRESPPRHRSGLGQR